MRLPGNQRGKEKKRAASRLGVTDARRRLVEVVNAMLERSMEVFWKAKNDSGFAGELSKELGEVEHLCWNFVSSAKTQKTQDRQKSTYEELQRHVGVARGALGEYKAGQDWTLGQVERLETAFKVRQAERGGPYLLLTSNAGHLRQSAAAHERERERGGHQSGQELRPAGRGRHRHARQAGHAHVGVAGPQR
jgi:hypothetical protein